MSESKSKSGGTGNTVSYSHSTSAPKAKPAVKTPPNRVAEAYAKYINSTKPAAKTPTAKTSTTTPAAKSATTAKEAIDFHNPFENSTAPKPIINHGHGPGSTTKPSAKPTVNNGPASVSNPYSNVGSSTTKAAETSSSKVGTAEFKPTAGTYQPSHVSETKVHTNPYGTGNSGYGKVTHNTGSKVDVAAGKTEAHYKLGNATGPFNSTHSIASNGVKAAEHGAAEKAGGMLSKVHWGHAGLLGAGLAVGGLAGYALKGNN